MRCQESIVSSRRPSECFKSARVSEHLVESPRRNAMRVRNVSSFFFMRDLAAFPYLWRQSQRSCTTTNFTNYTCLYLSSFRQRENMIGVHAGARTPPGAVMQSHNIIEQQQSLCPPTLLRHAQAKACAGLTFSGTRQACQTGSLLHLQHQRRLLQPLRHQPLLLLAAAPHSPGQL